MTHQQTETGMLRVPGYGHIQNTQLISRMEGTGNYTIIHLINDPKPLMVSETLVYFETRLPDFIRVSKSALINPSEVEKVIRHDAKTMYLELPGSVRILVSRRRINTVIDRLSK